MWAMSDWCEMVQHQCGPPYLLPLGRISERSPLADSQGVSRAETTVMWFFYESEAIQMLLSHISTASYMLFCLEFTTLFYNETMIVRLFKESDYEWFEYDYSELPVSMFPYYFILYSLNHGKSLLVKMACAIHTMSFCVMVRYLSK